MRVIVCGSRDFDDDRMLCRVLDRFHAKTPIALLIEGGQSGADSLARRWAIRHQVPNQRFKADWNHGLSGGPKRNRQMLVEGKPDAVIAFPGGKGTANMVRQATHAGVPVLLAKDI